MRRLFVLVGMDLPSSEHRPWPLPDSSWVMRQAWRHTLFAHWPLPVAAVRRVVPGELQPFIDQHAGSAWIGIVGFRAEKTQLRGFPPVPGLSDFVELNVRTYLTINGKPGVYFFSLDTWQVLACAGARLLFDLNYYPATITMRTRGLQTMIRSERWTREEARFLARYEPIDEPFAAPSEELTRFLIERYCLYTASSGRIRRTEIHHEPWSVSNAVARISVNTMTQPLRLALPSDAPVCHYAAHQEAFVWSPEPVSRRLVGVH